MESENLEHTAVEGALSENKPRNPPDDKERERVEKDTKFVLSQSETDQQEGLSESAEGDPSNVPPELTLVIFGDPVTVEPGPNLFLGPDKENEPFSSALYDLCGRVYVVYDLLKNTNHFPSDKDVSAFLLLLPHGHHVSQYESSVQWLKSSFGEGALDYLMTIVTHESNKQSEGKMEDLKECRSCSAQRFHVCSKKFLKDEKETLSLLEKIDVMVSKNDPKCYRRTQEEGPEPAQGGPGPEQEGPGPALGENVPAQGEPGPALGPEQGGPGPAQGGPALGPEQEGPGPAQGGPGLEQGGIALGPEQEGLGPAQGENVPAQGEPGPVQGGPGPELLLSNSEGLRHMKPDGDDRVIVDTRGSRRNSESQPSTESQMETALGRLGLKEYYPQRLSLKRILQIDHNAITDTPAQSNEGAVWLFLKKLMMVNVTARQLELTSQNESDETCVNIADLIKSSSEDNLSLHDIVTALFLCSDGFVQQELSLKMSMCQFAVPLLLPNCDTNQCTLMLWALRAVVKKYRPESLSESKGFKEERIVQAQIPMVSFVRLGEGTLSKSEVLNKLLSNSQQYQEFFVHHNMQYGDSPRKISDGLVEMTWYLPCGNKNIDIFNNPVAVANLRGDVASFERQFSFLCQTSSAVFVFLDSPDSECKQLMAAKGKAQLFLVVNEQSDKFSLKGLESCAKKLGLTNRNIILKSKSRNEADFVKKLQKAIRDGIEGTKKEKENKWMSLEEMASVANSLNVLVDEDCPECQNAKQNAKEITSKIQDIPSYKEKQLPRQGTTWKKLSSLEKEEVRLKKVGSENLQSYQNKLVEEKIELRKKQDSHDISEAMAVFTTSLSANSMERSYFLKWMQMKLDNLSLDKLSGLREQFKEQSKIPNNRDELRKIDEKLSNSSLGTEHFLREISQIYEASVSLSENNQFQHLPRLCANLMLDGFPLELVDGDASNIPLRWVSDVLVELNKLVTPGSKIRVVTVLGVQSTGKSTLLNTMFGVQFAVSSGRCTRGAYMLLIGISDDMKKNLHCDFLVIIDTEGLKSPELAQLENSYEHDNELATLVVGLSDVTIINIAMENAVEMKDTLQIVVHAFLRMKEIGKKPKCQFVHQNVSDVSAQEKNLRDRKKLLEQLDEMTQAAAKMEKKEHNKSFTDVMDYNCDTGNWYISGLWNGTPPMAPVNAKYSEDVYELKKNILDMLKDCESTANTFLEYREWIKSLWNAVKHENFIFSFKNSLVADAYMKLCTEFNKWEWEFKKDMFTWSTSAETQIKNFGTVKPEQTDVGGLMITLKTQLQKKLMEHEQTLLKNLKQYFEQKEGHVYLVESYKQQFQNSVKELRKEIERSVTSQLTATADIKKGMADVDRIKKEQIKLIEKQVLTLIENCRKTQAEMTDEDLDREFDQMWGNILCEFNFTKLTAEDIFNKVQLHLMQNLQDKGSKASELFSKQRIEDYRPKAYVYSPEGRTQSAKETLYKFFRYKDIKEKMQALADRVIDDCERYVDKKVEDKNNYHDTYIEEILLMIDNRLKVEKSVHIEFEVSLKIHICEDAARRFQKMHNDFLHLNDPYECLLKNKETFRSVFKAVYHQKDQCQKKAEEFTVNCLTPAVESYIRTHLGTDIINHMQSVPEMKERMSFQSSVLLELLQKKDFREYVRYTKTYEKYVKDLIRRTILKQFPDSTSTYKFEKKHIEFCVSLIKNATEKALETESTSLKDFVENMCSFLKKYLVISQNALDSFLFLNNANKEELAKWLTKSVDEISQSLEQKLSEPRIETKLQSLRRVPQNEIFNEIIGCGEQCPFCKVPCEAGARSHSEHFASLHRPQAFGVYRDYVSNKLTTDICTTDVSSDGSFRCKATGDKRHPYKEYRQIYPNWKIPPDNSHEASDYWKYVLVKFNHEFASEYNAQPADIPSSWMSITESKAAESVKNTYCC